MKSKKIDLNSKLTKWEPYQYKLDFITSNSGISVIDTSCMTVSEIKQELKEFGASTVVNNVKTGVLYAVRKLNWCGKDEKTNELGYSISILCKIKYPTGLIGYKISHVGFVKHDDFYKVFNDAQRFIVLKDNDGLFKDLRYGKKYV